jgi:hypothetical protein
MLANTILTDPSQLVRSNHFVNVTGALTLLTVGKFVTSLRTLMRMFSYFHITYDIIDLIELIRLN